jgi:hypothetical protein
VLSPTHPNHAPSAPSVWGCPGFCHPLQLSALDLVPLYPLFTASKGRFQRLSQL